ncbi:MAG: radical SAM protein [Anaerolineae bacterium]|nr:radical SAM protein [Anaerolineae bacterium]
MADHTANSTAPFVPAYRRLQRDGAFPDRVRVAQEALRDCALCGRECHIDRTQKPGSCRTGTDAIVSSAFPHMGEEDPLRGVRGSGTIFFSNCNLQCQFCQNYEISQEGQGQSVTGDQIASMMLHLQAMGCHNINLVSPSHVIPQIISAVYLAVEAGLHIPLVYNTGGYDSLDGLRLLDGIVDIYMPDMKYADPDVAQRFSKVPDYPACNQAAVREMHRQVGDLQLDARGIATRGLLVRHLVLPDDLAGTTEIVRFLVEEISTNTYINVMGQYRPEWRVRERNIAPLNRPVTRAEVEQAKAIAQRAGLRLDARRGWNLWLG